MFHFKRRFFQPRIKGGRLHVGAGVEEAIRKTVEREARRYGTSMSFVISVALADYFGIGLKHEEDYRQQGQEKGTLKRQQRTPEGSQEMTAH